MYLVDAPPPPCCITRWKSIPEFSGGKDYLAGTVAAAEKIERNF